MLQFWTPANEHKDPHSSLRDLSLRLRSSGTTLTTSSRDQPVRETGNNGQSIRPLAVSICRTGADPRSVRRNISKEAKIMWLCAAPPQTSKLSDTRRPFPTIINPNDFQISERFIKDGKSSSSVGKMAPQDGTPMTRCRNHRLAEHPIPERSVRICNRSMTHPSSAELPL